MKLRILASLLAAATLTAALPSSAQEADPADVESVDAIITALYASISGPLGEPRDRDRFMSLFAPDARLLPTNGAAETGYVALTPDEYWARSSQALSDLGFTEAEIGRVTETFGMVTHVFSAYASFRQDRGDPDTPFARGINSIQLLHHRDRFWILTVFWDSERPDNPIPDRYLRMGGSGAPSGR